MKPYKVNIRDKALWDINDIADWYNQQVPNLGSRFKKSLKLQINSLKNNPYGYNIRYDDVRCMPSKKFPLLTHYFVNEINHIVEIFAVIHTSRNPKIWEQRSQDI